ncbi:MAG: signal peptide peptidase SppA [Nanobdellota archaeon]
MGKKEKEKNNLLLYIGIVAVVFLLLIIGIPLVSFMIQGFSSEDDFSKGNVAIINIEGPIVSGNSVFDSDRTYSESISRYINKAEDDNSIKGVVFKINSPGGSGVASKEIADEINDLSKKKPTVSYIKDVGASGSYWVASSTDKIFANELSIVGSIGVIASYLEFSDFLEEYNITYQRFVSGDHKDFGSPFREPTEDEEKNFQNLLDEHHHIFIREVAKNRNIDIEKLKNISDGSIYSASKSIEYGLIDEFGGKEEAIDYLEEILEIDAKIVKYQKKASIFESLSGLVSQVSQKTGHAIGNGFADKLMSNNGLE